MGKAAICNPYLDTLGGGERYTVAFARVLADSGWEVDIEWKDQSLKDKLESRFGLSLKGLNFVPDTKKGSGYDLCFWVSDGSIPLLHSRKNILHFQMPFHDVDGKSLFNRMKFFRINKVVCNSSFTKSVINKEYGIESVVIYPPVDVEKIKPKRKENLILYVGRFSGLVQAKRQDILVKAFKKLAKDTEYCEWKLILAGGVEVGADDTLKEIEKLAAGSKVEIFKSPTYKEIKDLYGRARLFWSAAGFGEDEEREPEKVEHFGITAVEAMAAGAVPIVYNAGGVKEVVKDGENGFFWKKEGELLNISKRLMNNKKLLREKSVLARDASRKFGYERFREEVLGLLEKI